MNTSHARLLKVNLNLGSIHSFQLSEDGAHFVDKFGLRKAYYRTEDLFEKFPLIFHPEMLDACCEMNLFLRQRARGEFSTHRNKTELSKIVWSEAYIASQSGEPLDRKTVCSIAKDLKLFLDFLASNNLSYISAISMTVATSDKELLPPWKYQQHLVSLVKSRRLTWNTAQRMISRVRQLYIWSYLRGVVHQLPFQLENKPIKKQKVPIDDPVSSVPSQKDYGRGISQWVSDLKIPKKFKQKDKKPEGLQPFGKDELTLLLQTDVALHPTYGAFLKCAYLAGLRSFEVVQIDASEIVNPDEDKKRVSYKIGVVRKHHMPKPVNITRTLMKALYEYTASQEWMKRRIKHEIKYGVNNPEHPLPLFLNRSGERMAETSPCDTIKYVREELKRKNKPPLTRSYHDLRATFGTYLAVYLIKKYEEPKRVRSILRKWMGHENFETTESYIDFAKVCDPSEFGDMDQWVEEIYSAVKPMLDGEANNG